MFTLEEVSIFVEFVKYFTSKKASNIGTEIGRTIIHGSYLKPLLLGLSCIRPWSENNHFFQNFHQSIFKIGKWVVPSAIWIGTIHQPTVFFFTFWNTHQSHQYGSQWCLLCPEIVEYSINFIDWRLRGVITCVLCNAINLYVQKLLVALFKTAVLETIFRSTPAL